MRQIGPATVEVAPGRPGEGDRPGVSATFRNIAAKDELPTTVFGCSTLYEIFNHAVDKHGSNRCLGWRPVGEDGKAKDYEFINYSQTREKARQLASALVQLGLKPKQKLGIYSINTVEWMLAARACDIINVTVVPIYDSLGDSAVEYIVNHSESSVVLVEAGKFNKLTPVLDAINDNVHTIIFIGKGDEASIAAAKEAGMKVLSFAEALELGSKQPVTPVPPTADDIACIMYTSGTTGTPKGVLVNHRCFVSALAGAHILFKQANINITDTDGTLSYMPLAHSFDRIIEELALSVGGFIGYWQGNVKLLMDDVAALKPTLFIAVPRILERVADTVRGKVAKSSKLQQALFWGAYNYKLFLLRRGVPHGIAGALVDQLVFKKVRQALGGRVRFIVSGGAPLAPYVEDFCNVCMAPLLQGYGLTETTAASFIIFPNPRLAYTVGPPLSATEFRLESVPALDYDATEQPPKGEVCIRGPMVFAGYYKDPDRTKEDMDADGFFHTGDIGVLTNEGCLKIIDRKKNIFKMAQGEYIAVEHLESTFSHAESVEQIWVYGNSLEAFLVAVVVPKDAFLAKFGNDKAAAAKSPEARKAMLDDLTNIAKEYKLKGFEFVKAVHLETEHFSVENDLLTPSFKVKRPQLLKHYQKEVDAMYADLRGAAATKNN